MIKAAIRNIQQRRENMSRARLGYYVGGTPMTDEDKTLFTVLDYVSIGGLIIVGLSIAILITLGVTGS